ncbi:MAG: winged helix-turn-helix domain-containing protein [Saprospiraceae bacterium]|nr:winged helix-turn-helix domain-containing protein [Saprospiraceae bacterium]
MNTKLILNDQILVDAQSGEIKFKHQNDAIRLEPLLLALLLMLARQPQQLILREQIIASLWDGDARVGNPALTKAISKLRQLFIQYFNAPDLIETLPKKGYRFVADVKQQDVVSNSIKKNIFFITNQSFIKQAVISVLTLFLFLLTLKFIGGAFFYHVLHGAMH